MTAYRGIVQATILAKDKREARRALESIRAIGGGVYGPQVQIDSREGPDEVVIPNN